MRLDLDERPGFARAARHDGRPEQRALFAPRHARPDKEHARLAARRQPPVRVEEVRVACRTIETTGALLTRRLVAHEKAARVKLTAINDDVAFV